MKAVKAKAMKATPLKASKTAAAMKAAKAKPMKATPMKANKAGTGSLLQLTFQVIEGDYANRLLWDRLNLDHPNATAVQIARADLSAICRAVGVLSPKDSVELHNLPLVIHVRCKKRTDTGELVNEIKGYSKKDEPPAAANAAPASDNTPPWKRS